MSDEFQKPSGDCITDRMRQRKAEAQRKAHSSAPSGSVSAEQWWSHHAELLAAKMKVGGVKSFRIELNARGNYEFEVIPTATPNVALTDPAVKPEATL